MPRANALLASTAIPGDKRIDDPAEPTEPRRPAAYAAWRPTQAAAALGLAGEYLSTKPAFARLPFGEWSRTLFWQTARSHYVFAIEANQRIVGFLGWALTDAQLAQSWLKGASGLSNDQCLAGDCVIVNAWAADSAAANDFLYEVASKLFAGASAVYFKRHYSDGRERAVRLAVARHRRTGKRP